MTTDDVMTLPSFVSRYPWSKAVLRWGEPLEWLWHFDLEVDPEAVWAWFADTSRLNRAIGGPVMHFEEQGSVVLSSARLGGIPSRWIEHPWEWVVGRNIEYLRELQGGLARYWRIVYHIEDLGEGRTRAFIYYGWIARNVLGRIALRLAMPAWRRRYQRALSELAAGGARGVHPFHRPPPPLPSGAAARLETLRSALLAIPDLSREAIDRVCTFVETADDLDAYRIRIRELARRWEVDELDAIRVCLHAARSGLLALSWDVMCPYCRGMREDSRALADVPPASACAVCGAEFSTDGEHAVEISFRVDPSVRDVPHRLYCSAEPSTRPHIKLQQTLEPGERRDVPTRLVDGAYRIRIRGRTGAERLDVVSGEAERVCHWLDMETRGTDAARVGPSPTVILENPTREPQTFIVETPVWSDGVLQPGDLFSLQEFRDLFPDQQLASNVRLHAGDQTILYIDMVRPLALFSAREDGEAHEEVRALYAELGEVVKRSRGAVIKTTGDAVTAAFSHPIDGLQAAGGILERHANPGGGDALRLRASLNRGPCLAVNLDNHIDYFGSAVSLAAKLQTVAGAGQVAFPAAVREAPGVDSYLEKAGAQPALISYEAPGLDRPIPAYVWDPAIASH